MRSRDIVLGLALVLGPLTGAPLAQKQAPPSAPQEPAARPRNPQRISVDDVKADDRIATRLQHILDASGWYEGGKVAVRSGIVFLSGSARSAEQRAWAGDLASRTEDVVAVVNDIAVQEQPVSLDPALSELRRMAKETIGTLPLIGVSLLLLCATVLACAGVRRLARRWLQERMQSDILRQVAANACMIPFALIGLYIVLRVSGLTQLALTVIGGTGLIGLIIGIAFRDIAENFLASILISAQRPFQIGDLVTIASHQGYVQRVSLRGTLLMTLDGNYVQIPNATVYKSEVVNLTAAKNGRQQFTLEVDRTADLAAAQQAVLDAIRSHPAVLVDPEPLVLVSELRPERVLLTAYFWMDMTAQSAQRTKSAVMRLVSATLPPVAKSGPARRARTQAAKKQAAKKTGAPVAVSAEGQQESDSVDLEKQVQASRMPDTAPALVGDGVEKAEDKAGGIREARAGA